MGSVIDYKKLREQAIRIDMAMSRSARRVGDEGFDRINWLLRNTIDVYYTKIRLKDREYGN